MNIHLALDAYQQTEPCRKAVPDVQHHNLGAVHEQGGHVSGVLLIPPQSQQGGVRLGRLIYYGGMLLVPAHIGVQSK